MAALEAGRHLVSFRLSEVPESVRHAALDKLLKTPGTPGGMLVETSSLADRLALGVAATSPSERVYWVSRAAWEKARRSRLWR